MQTLISAALVLLAEREGGTGRLEEAVAAYRLVLEVYTREQEPQEWAAVQLGLLRVYQVLGDKWAMASVAGELLQAEPDNAEFFGIVQGLYHDIIFDFAAAYRLNGAWLERHPDDLGAQRNFAETHFTTGHFTDAELQLATLIQGGRLPPETAAALRLLEIANLLALGKSNAASAKVNALKTLVQAQPEEFTVGWTFAGTAHFITSEPSLSDHREMLLGLIEAAQSGDRQTLVTALETAQAKLHTAD